MSGSNVYLSAPPAGASGSVALNHITATAIGGVLQGRAQITITSNDPGNVIYVLPINDGTTPTAATALAQGTPIQPYGSYSLNIGLRANGTGGVTPVIWGISTTGDQSSPADTRWQEGV